MTERSTRELRSRLSIDDEVLHKTGKKVPKLKEPEFECAQSSQETSSESESYNDCELNSADNTTFTILDIGITEISDSLANIHISNTMSTERSKSIILHESLRDDIIDYIDEHPADSFLSIEDIDASVSKLEHLRSRYRNTHKDIRYEQEGEYEKYQNEFDETMKFIKNFITIIKKIRTQIR